MQVKKLILQFCLKAISKSLINLQKYNFATEGFPQIPLTTQIGQFFCDICVICWQIYSSFLLTIKYQLFSSGK